MSDSAPQPTSTKPYLLRALYEWCCDNGYTPYLAVRVDSSVRVPREHVRNGEIVLNISFGATSGLNLGNDDIQFKARFGGVAREIVVPISHVTAIYARENGQGMAFPPPQVETDSEDAAGQSASPPATPPRLHSVPQPGEADRPEGDHEPEPPPRAPAGGHLKRVK